MLPLLAIALLLSVALETRVFTAASSAPSAVKFKFRNINAGDVPRLAAMCAETFEGPFTWLETFKRQKYVNEFESQFSDRYTRLVKGGIQHAMVLCETEPSNAGFPTSSVAGESEVVAFLEVGLLPSPLLIKTTWEGQEAEARPEVPFLGNVAVSPGHRRQGLAKKLIRIGEKVAQKWSHDALYVAVEADNTAALSLYKKMQFSVVLDERDQMNRRGNRVFMKKDVRPTITVPPSPPSPSSSAD